MGSLYMNKAFKYGNTIFEKKKRHNIESYEFFTNLAELVDIIITLDGFELLLKWVIVIDTQI